jgi:hypothetical protein
VRPAIRLGSEAVDNLNGRKLGRHTGTLPYDSRRSALGDLGVAHLTVSKDVQMLRGQAVHAKPRSTFLLFMEPPASGVTGRPTPWHGLDAKLRLTGGGAFGQGALAVVFGGGRRSDRRTRVRTKLRDIP